MARRNQKDLIPEIVMNFIPKKRVDPPKVSLEKMVQEYVPQPLRQPPVQKEPLVPDQTIIQETPKVSLKDIQEQIEEKQPNISIVITNVEPIKVVKNDDIPIALGGNIRNRVSRKRSRKIVKSTVEKLVDNRLKTDFIEVIKHKSPVKPKKSPTLSNYFKKEEPLAKQEPVNDNKVGGDRKKSRSLSPIRKFKSPNKNSISKKPESPKIVRQKSRQISRNIGGGNTSNKIATSKVSSNNSRRMVSNRKNNYARNGFLGIEMFDNEPKVHKTPFRDMEINLTDDEKKSRKSLKKSKKSKKNQKGGSKKSRRHKSKKTNRSRSNDSDRISSKNNRIPNYLRFDLEHLIGDDINYYHAGGYAHTSSRNSSPKISRKNSRRH